MPLDPHVKRFLDRLAASLPRNAGELSVADRRIALERLLSLGGSADPVAGVEERVAPGPAGGLRIRSYTPIETRSTILPGLVFFHGGGLVAGSLDTHDGICRALANASGCRVLSVDYRLGPESRFPAAVSDACAATAWIAGRAEELGVDPKRLGVGGDSAGATLAAVVCQNLARGPGPRIALQFLLCPILDYRAATASREEFAVGHLLDRETLQHDLRNYLSLGDDPEDPRVSPARMRELAGLPPTCIHSAECDPLRDEAESYAQRLTAAGVATKYRCHPGMIHLFYGLGGVIPYASEAYKLMAADIRAVLH
ncbi:MAG: alpha/beta hydrolase [Steroidobacteraceae bacterium]